MPAEAADSLVGFGPSALAVYLVLAVVAVFLRRPPRQFAASRSA